MITNSSCTWHTNHDDDDDVDDDACSGCDCQVMLTGQSSHFALLQTWWRL